MGHHISDNGLLPSVQDSAEKVTCPCQNFKQFKFYIGMCEKLLVSVKSLTNCYGLFCTKPLSEPMLINCQSGTYFSDILIIIYQLSRKGINIKMSGNGQNACHFVDDLELFSSYMIWCLPDSVFNSSPPSAAYMRRWTGSALFQVMACRLFADKPLPEPMLTYCQLDS